MAFTIRRATGDDASAVCNICLKTGDAGKDATALFPHRPDLLGLRWAVPYLEELALVLEHSEHGVCG